MLIAAVRILRPAPDLAPFGFHKLVPFGPSLGLVCN